MQAFVDFMKENLTCSSDRTKCIEYIQNNSASFDCVDTAYALGIVDRWIAVGMFRGKLVLQHMDDTHPTQQQQHELKRPASCRSTEAVVVVNDGVNKRQRLFEHV
jgi:hypothetical protein